MDSDRKETEQQGITGNRKKGKDNDMPTAMLQTGIYKQSSFLYCSRQ